MGHGLRHEVHRWRGELWHGQRLHPAIGTASATIALGPNGPLVAGDARADDPRQRHVRRLAIRRVRHDLAVVLHLCLRDLFHANGGRERGVEALLLGHRPVHVLVGYAWGLLGGPHSYHGHPESRERLPHWSLLHLRHDRLDDHDEHAHWCSLRGRDGSVLDGEGGIGCCDRQEQASAGPREVALEGRPGGTRRPEPQHHQGRVRVDNRDPAGCEATAGGGRGRGWPRRPHRPLLRGRGLR
mmetsp:Transcript_994/g.2142  ORF Transcript_994/g.2142 Transcript_994/m.2142 type:complete len:241 (+) Transcript_994:681-1403(+)